MHELTSRFVSAFNRIEKRLEAIVGPKDYLPFTQLVDKAASKNSAVKQFKKRLKSLGNLRNLLVHDHEHDKEVAVPTERTVRGIEILAESYVLVAQTATVFDALKEFDQSLHSGRVLQAVILTASGQPSETPLGIVTPTDIPGLVRAAEP